MAVSQPIRQRLCRFFYFVWLLPAMVIDILSALQWKTCKNYHPTLPHSAQKSRGGCAWQCSIWYNSMSPPSARKRICFGTRNAHPRVANTPMEWRFEMQFETPPQERYDPYRAIHHRSLPVPECPLRSLANEHKLIVGRCSKHLEIFQSENRNKV